MIIKYLINYLRAELNKPATDLMYHNLQRLLDKGITETNAQFEPSYIISKLEVKLLTVKIISNLFLNINKFKICLILGKSSPNDVGWDVFSLDYNMDIPLKTVKSFFFANSFIAFI